MSGETGGYLTLRRRWATGDRVVLELPMPVRITRADGRIDAVRGCGAIEVGPLVYCLEDHDQPDGVSVDDVVLDGGDPEREWRADLLGGVAVVHVDGRRRTGPPEPFPYRAADAGETLEPVRLVAVPYHAWANRGVRAMRVWVPLEGSST